MPDGLPDAYFGPVGKQPHDWRKQPDIGSDDDADLAVTPPDVVALLGFDPVKEKAE
jgi:hypothetical protein